jgi:hypothetical protein
MTACVVEELGETEQWRLDVLVGALILEQGYIQLDPRPGELDRSGLRKRELTGYPVGECPV